MMGLFSGSFVQGLDHPIPPLYLLSPVHSMATASPTVSWTRWVGFTQLIERMGLEEPSMIEIVNDLLTLYNEFTEGQQKPMSPTLFKECLATMTSDASEITTHLFDAIDRDKGQNLKPVEFIIGLLASFLPVRRAEGSLTSALMKARRQITFMYVNEHGDGVIRERDFLRLLEVEDQVRISRQRIPAAEGLISCISGSAARITVENDTEFRVDDESRVSITCRASDYVREQGSYLNYDAFYNAFEAGVIPELTHLLHWDLDLRAALEHRHGTPKPSAFQNVTGGLLAFVDGGLKVASFLIGAASTIANHASAVERVENRPPQRPEMALPGSMDCPYDERTPEHRRQADNTEESMLHRSRLTPLEAEAIITVCEDSSPKSRIKDHANAPSLDLAPPLLMAITTAAETDACENDLADGQLQCEDSSIMESDPEEEDTRPDSRETMDERQAPDDNLKTDRFLEMLQSIAQSVESPELCSEASAEVQALFGDPEDEVIPAAEAQLDDNVQDEIPQEDEARRVPSAELVFFKKYVVPLLEWHTRSEMLRHLPSVNELQADFNQIVERLIEIQGHEKIIMSLPKGTKKCLIIGKTDGDIILTGKALRAALSACRSPDLDGTELIPNGAVIVHAGSWLCPNDDHAYQADILYAMMALIALKIQFPTRFYLLRGLNEGYVNNALQACATRCLNGGSGLTMWNRIQDLTEYVSVGFRVGTNGLVLGGRLTTELQPCVRDLNTLSKPMHIEVTQRTLNCDPGASFHRVNFNSMIAAISVSYDRKGNNNSSNKAAIQFRNCEDVQWIIQRQLLSVTNELLWEHYAVVEATLDGNVTTALQKWELDMWRGIPCGKHNDISAWQKLSEEVLPRWTHCLTPSPSV
eukprot:Blabericola_migrator_1__943@NODE_1236_length_5021_cov_406_391805_g836_i0_p1_GENE_NODE_1236_length_5021_cov_406_391805_g836_i0NODE_1236_length_5021_cov_406_391805_g836_i0_p1_ORF_typecomplete_len871_score132_46UCH/PF00443_29/0_13_NODE_1236_length_5021_cov_406_391805_g836_i022234835